MNVISSVLFSNIEQKISSSKDLNQPEPISSKKIYISSSQQDYYLSHLIEKNKVDENCDLNKSFTQSSLPSLKKQQQHLLINLLTQERLVRGNQTAIEIKFNLVELFSYLYTEGKRNRKAAIIEIELVGSGVFWVLEDYIKEIMQPIGLLDEALSEESIKEFAPHPSDLDYRIHLDNAVEQDIHFYQKSVVSFFAKKANRPYANIKKEIFTKFPLPIINAENQYAVIGLHDTYSNFGLDIMIVKKIFRCSLFIQDALRLPLLDMLKAAHFFLSKSDAEKKELLLKANNTSIIPISDHGNGLQAIIDRLTGVIRAIEPKTIDMGGWSLLLVSYLKGRRCLDIELEKILLKEFEWRINHLDQSRIKMPKPLIKTLQTSSMNVEEKFGASLSFMLIKAVATHYQHNKQKSALVLALQAAASLFKYECPQVIPYIIKKMEFYFDYTIDEDPLFYKMASVLKQNPLLISLIHSLLEVKAFIFLNIETTMTDFKKVTVNLIHHQGTLHIKYRLESFCLLLKFDPIKSLQNLMSLLKELYKKNDSLIITAVEALQEELKMEGCFTQKNQLLMVDYLDDKESISNQFGVFLDEMVRIGTPYNWQETLIDWILCYRLFHPNVFKAPYIESLIFICIQRNSDIQRQIWLLDYAAKGSTSESEILLYTLSQQLLLENINNNIPFLYIWAMAQVKIGDESRFFSACKIFIKAFESHKSFPFTPVLQAFFMDFISYIIKKRPDLALTLLSDLSNLEMESKNIGKALVEIHKGIKDTPINDYLCHFIHIAKKIFTVQIEKNESLKISPSLHKALTWIVQHLLKAQNIQEGINISKTTFQHWINTFNKSPYNEKHNFVLKFIEPFLLENYLEEASAIWAFGFRLIKKVNRQSFAHFIECSKKLSEAVDPLPSLAGQMFFLIISNEQWTQEEFNEILSWGYTLLPHLGVLESQFKIEELFIKTLEGNINYFSLKNALGILSSVKNTSALWWHIFYQKLDATSDKTLIIEAWKAYYFNLVLNKSIHNATLVTSKTFIHALKLILELEPFIVFELINGFSQYSPIILYEDMAESANLFLSTFYNSLSISIKDSNKQKKIHEIEQAYRILLRIFSEPLYPNSYWMKIKEILINFFSSKKKFYWQMQAINLQIEAGLFDEAVKNIPSLFQVRYQTYPREMIRNVLFIFWEKLPSPRLGLSLDLLNEPLLLDILRSDSNASLKALTKLFDKALKHSKENNILKKCLLHGLKLIINTEEKNVYELACRLVTYLQSLPAIAADDSELIQSLHQEYKRLWRALSNKEFNAIQHYHFLFELYRHKLPFTIEENLISTYYQMFLNLSRTLESKINLAEFIELFQWFQQNSTQQLTTNEIQIYWNIIDFLLSQDCVKEAKILIYAFLQRLNHKSETLLSNENSEKILSWIDFCEDIEYNFALKLIEFLIKKDSSKEKILTEKIFLILQNENQCTNIQLKILDKHLFCLQKYISSQKLQAAVWDVCNPLLNKADANLYIKIIPLLSLCEAISANQWHDIISQICKFENTDLSITIWHLFWNILEPRFLSDKQYEITFHCWLIILPAIFKHHSAALFIILLNIDRLSIYFKNLESNKFTLYVMLFDYAAKSLPLYNPANNIYELDAFLKAYAKVFSGCEEVIKNSPLSSDLRQIEAKAFHGIRILALFRGGNVIHFQMAQIQLLHFIEDTVSDLNQVYLIGEWLGVLVDNVIGERQAYIFGFYLPLLFDKLNKLLFESKLEQFPGSLEFLIQHTLPAKLSSAGFLKYLNLFKTQNSPAFIFQGCATLLRFLKKNTIVDNELLIKFDKELIEFLTETEKHSFYFSNEFLQFFLTVPLLELKHFPQNCAIIEKLVLILNCSITMKLKSRFLNPSPHYFNEMPNLDMTGYIHNYLPLLIKDTKALKICLKILNLNLGLIFKNNIQLYLESMKIITLSIHKTHPKKIKNIKKGPSYLLEYSKWQFEHILMLIKNLPSNTEDFLRAYEIIFHNFKQLINYPNELWLEYPTLINEYICLPIPDSLKDLKKEHLNNSLPELISLDLSQTLTHKKKHYEKIFLENLSQLCSHFPEGIIVALNLLIGKYQPSLLIKTPFIYADYWIQIFSTYKQKCESHALEQTLSIIFNILISNDPTNPFSKKGKNEVWQKQTIRVCDFIFTILLDNEFKTGQKETAPSFLKLNKIFEYLLFTLLYHFYENQHSFYLSLLERLFPLCLHAEPQSLLQVFTEFFKLLWLEDKTSQLNLHDLNKRSELLTFCLQELEKIDSDLARYFLEKSKFKIINYLKH